MRNTFRLSREKCEKRREREREREREGGRGSEEAQFESGCNKE